MSKPTALAVCGLLLFAPLLMLTLTPKDTAQNAFLDVNAPLWLDFVKRQPAHWTKLFTKPSLTFKSATDDLAKVQCCRLVNECLAFFETGTIAGCGGHR